MHNNLRFILIHGNGGCTPNDIWFPYVKSELQKLGFEVLAPQFPDSVLARGSYWLPFLENELKVDSNTILIGHSSGAIAAMRYAEKHKIFGSVLIGTYHTDLGLDSEKISGYFDTPWNWETIKNNQNWIIEFASIDDPWIPIAEPRFVHDMLKTEYYEDQDQGHYNTLEFPELISSIKSKLLDNK